MHLLHWPQPQGCNCLQQCPRRQNAADRLPPCRASQNALSSSSRSQSPANVQQLLLCFSAPSTISLAHTSLLPTVASLHTQGKSSRVCAAATWGRDSASPSRSQSPPPRPKQPPSPPAASPSPPPSFASSSSSPQQPQQSRPSSAYQRRTQRRSSADSFAMSDSYDEGLEAGPNSFAAVRSPSTPFPSLSSMDQHIDAYSSEELLRPNSPSPSASGRGGFGDSGSSGSAGSLSAYLASAFPDASRERSRTSRSRRSSLSMPPSYSTGKGLPGSSAAGNIRDPFAAFRAYQQAAPLQQAGVGGVGMMGEGGFEGMEHLQAFRRTIMPKLRRGWFASSGYNAEQLSQEILTRCERRPCGMEPLFMLIRLCESQEDARTALATISAVRAASARLQGDLVPFMNQGGHNLAKAFTQMCCRCDASDVMASALIHASEVGLPITYKCVHLAMTHWAQLQELPKMEQVLEAMPQGGLPFNPKTAYVIIRGAVNAGRQELAEAYAARMMANGVRLHPSVNMLLEVGRERAKQRVQAMQWSEDE